MSHRGLLHHMIINVSNVERSSPFYTAMFGYLGYELSGSSYGEDYGYEDWKRWDLDTPHEISICQVCDPLKGVAHQRGALGHHCHIAFCAEDCDDVDRFHREVLVPLAGQGLCTIEDAPCDCPEYNDGYYATYFTDPDGLKYEFVINPNHLLKKAARETVTGEACHAPISQPTFPPMYSADPTRYDGRMPFRRCGDSGLLLPEISLGCWHNFGHVDDQHEARAILRRAFDRGITHFDLANNYGPPSGSAEENVGRILSEDFAAHRDELIISSKAGHEMWQGPYGEWGSRKHVLASLDQSLKRLRVDYVDIFYSHRPDKNTRLEETMSALATAVNSGRALYVGLSKYPMKMLKQAVKILKDMGIRCLIYQPPYSILNRWPEAEGIHDWLEDKGIGSIVFSPLAQGMLTGKYVNGIPAGSRAARSEGFLQTSQVDAQIEKIRALHRFAEDRGMSLQHLALRWVLSQSAVTSAIIGARTVAQLDDSLAALQAPALDEEALEIIDAIAPAVQKDDAEG